MRASTIIWTASSGLIAAPKSPRGIGWGDPNEKEAFVLCLVTAVIPAARPTATVGCSGSA